MKQGIHPPTYPVLFVDGDHTWTGISTLKTAETRTVDGVEHYVVNVEISAFSHPFYTGQKKIIDSAGRVDTSSTGASSGGATLVFPPLGAPEPVRRTPIGSANSSAVGTIAGIREVVGIEALAADGGGISSRRGSAVAAVGRSLTRLDSASSAFLPLAANL